MALASTATVALARSEPWTRGQPAGMQQAHVQMAAAAKAVADRAGPGGFGLIPNDRSQVSWSWMGRRNQETPVANMSVADLNALLVGRYWVRTNGRNANWVVSYNAPDGRTFSCTAGTSGGGEELVTTRVVTASMFGLGGFFTSHDTSTIVAGVNDRGWPVVADPRTGRVSTYAWGGKNWLNEAGCVQDEYAQVWEQFCPNLPRVGQVNQAQSGRTIQEIARGARAITGFPVAFPNDPRVPLTAEMCYWAYPPVR